MRTLAWLGLAASVLVTTTAIAAQRPTVQKAPAGLSRPFATVQKKPPVVQKRPPGLDCYTPPVRRFEKIPMSALPPPGLCLGKQGKEGGVAYCYSCGGYKQVAGGCVSCKTGYHFGHAGRCCKGSPPPLPTPK
jgi:hypothetical protein